VATNSFVCGKILEQSGLPESKVTRYDTPLREIIIEYIEKRGSLESDNSAKTHSQ